MPRPFLRMLLICVSLIGKEVHELITEKCQTIFFQFQSTVELFFNEHTIFDKLLTTTKK